MSQAALARRDGNALADVYERLRRRRGPSGWWPAEDAFEVCVGAILVQNTAWANAEKALAALRGAGCLSFRRLAGLDRDALAALIRPAGCHNVKARRVSAFLDFLGCEYGGRAEAMASQEPQALRAQLLGVTGIGRETADSIVLYAAALPLFVVDAYTRRIFGRLGLIAGDEAYDTLQDRFMSELPMDAALFNDYHAQIVRHAKETCRPKPLCAECVLAAICPGVGVPAARGFAPRPHEWV